MLVYHDWLQLRLVCPAADMRPVLQDLTASYEGFARVFAPGAAAWPNGRAFVGAEQVHAEGA